MPAKSMIKPPRASFGKNLGLKFLCKGSQSYPLRNGPTMSSFGCTGDHIIAICDRTQPRSKPEDFSHRPLLTVGSKRGRESLRLDLWSAGKSGVKKILNACVDAEVPILRRVFRLDS